MASALFTSQTPVVFSSPSINQSVLDGVETAINRGSTGPFSSDAYFLNVAGVTSTVPGDGVLGNVKVSSLIMRGTATMVAGQSTQITYSQFITDAGGLKNAPNLTYPVVVANWSSPGNSGTIYETGGLSPFYSVVKSTNPSDAGTFNWMVILNLPSV